MATDYSISEDPEKLKLVHSIMLPTGKIPELDLILCNKKYDDSSKPFEGVQCKNYRGIDISGNTYYLKVGSIDLENPTSYSIDYSDFIKTRCEDLSGNSFIEDMKAKGGLLPENTVYFKGAFTVYPADWKDRKLYHSDVSSQFDIFIKATRGILLNILPLFKKLGIKTLVVDPEPGYHPKTTTKSDDERLEGLIKLYEKMGLKKVNCLYRTMADMFVKSGMMTISDIRTQMLKSDIRKDTIVMIGDVDEMVSKLPSVTALTFASLMPTKAGTEARETLKFMEVPIRFSEIHNDVLNQSQFDALKATPLLSYKQKYLKYKSKYTNLKKRMFFNN